MSDSTALLIESAMPTYDVDIAEHIIVGAGPAATFAAARELDANARALSESRVSLVRGDR